MTNKKQTKMFEEEEHGYNEDDLTPENSDDGPPMDDVEFEEVDEGEVREGEDGKPVSDVPAVIKDQPPVETEMSIEEELEQKFLQVSVALKVATQKYIKKPEFWTRWGDKYRPNHPALARCARRIGLSWETRLIKETVQEGYVSCMFECRMEFTRLVPADKTAWDVGVPGVGEWNSLKPAYKHVKDFRTVYGDIYKAGRSQAEVNAYMMLLGIKNMDETDMKQLGLDVGNIDAVGFKKNKH